MATNGSNLQAVVPSSVPPASLIRTWRPDGQRRGGARELRSGGRNRLFEAVQKPHALPAGVRGYAIHVLLSSTYLSHGVMRPRVQSLWGRVAPPFNQLISPRIAAIRRRTGGGGLVVVRPRVQAIMEIAAKAPPGCPFPTRQSTLTKAPWSQNGRARPSPLTALGRFRGSGRAPGNPSTHRPEPEPSRCPCRERAA